MPPPASSARARRYVFTVNNPSEEDHVCLVGITIDCPDFRYLIYQSETAPSTGTEHLQGYVEFTAPYRFNRVRQLLPDGAHVESAHGSPESNILYCSKESCRVSGPFIYGTPSVSSQGRRSDLHSAIETLSKKRSLQEAVEEEEFARSFVKYHAGFEKLARYRGIPLTKRQAIQPRRVVAFYGPTGTGKSHRAYHELCALYPEEDPYIAVDNSGKWFDGYVNQRGVLFDDFRGSGSGMPVDFFLRLTDKYPMKVPVKGSFVDWKPDTIYFTGNEHPYTWYSEKTPATQAAVNRRFHLIEELTEPYVEEDQAEPNLQ